MGAAAGAISIFLASMALVSFATVLCSRMVKGCFKRKRGPGLRALYGAAALASLLGVVFISTLGFVWIGAILYHPAH